MTVRAFIELGFHDEAGSFLGWLLHATRLTRPKLRALYPAVALAVSETARQNNKVFLAVGPATSDLTGAKCNVNTIPRTRNACGTPPLPHKPRHPGVLTPQCAPDRRL